MLELFGVTPHTVLKMVLKLEADRWIARVLCLFTCFVPGKVACSRASEKRLVGGRSPGRRFVLGFSYSGSRFRSTSGFPKHFQGDLEFFGQFHEILGITGPDTHLLLKVQTQLSKALGEGF